MLPFRLVFDEGYDLNLGDHVFPTQKYRLIREKLLHEGFAGPEDFVAPQPSPDEDLLLVHSEEWVRRLKNGTLSFHEILKLEIPYSRLMVEAFCLAAGGTTLASRLALRDRIGFNVGGGFHHAFRGHGEGFCAINDIAVAIRTLQRDGAIGRAMVVDCDVHQGNGTATLFAGDATVFTISIHQFNNYPGEKPPSAIDIHLPDQTGDDDYLEQLKEKYIPALEEFKPDLVLYVAGADPFYQDQIGGLGLTLAGLQDRDRLVMENALRRNVPVAVTLAGGYAFRLEDTVAIHCNTARAAKEVVDAATPGH